MKASASTKVSASDELEVLNSRDWPARALRRRLLFVLAIKIHTNVQFWYFILWPAFILPISDRRVRWALWLATPLLDVGSTMALCGRLILAPLPDAYLLLTALTPLTWKP